MNEDQVIAKAYERSCDFLGLESEKLLNAYSIGKLNTKPDFEQFKRELALKVILIYRDLTTLVGDNNRIWLSAHNLYFDARPIDVIYLGEIDKVVNYLENALDN